VLILFPHKTFGTFCYALAVSKPGPKFFNSPRRILGFSHDQHNFITFKNYLIPAIDIFSQILLRSSSCRHKPQTFLLLSEFAFPLLLDGQTRPDFLLYITPIYLLLQARYKIRYNWHVNKGWRQWYSDSLEMVLKSLQPAIFRSPNFMISFTQNKHIITKNEQIRFWTFSSTLRSVILLAAVDRRSGTAA
jgi:hypothetical protein